MSMEINQITCICIFEIYIFFFLKIFMHTYYFSIIVFLVNQTECDERQVLNKEMLGGVFV